MKRILFNLASRGRPGECFDTVCNVSSLAFDSNYFRFLIKVDSNDPERKRYEKYDMGAVAVESSGKIGVINSNIPEDDWDILVNLSDDMRFLRSGFDTIISTLCTPDTFLHLPDQYAKEKISTMSIMGRAYYDRFGYIYHPSYKSFYADEEATEVAKSLGCYVLGPAGIIEHRHPAAGAGKQDELYRRNQRYWNQDKQNFNLRKQKGFPL